MRIIPYKKLIMSEYHLLMSLEGVWDCFLIFITVDTFIMILSNKETRMITISAWVQQEKKKLQRRPSSWFIRRCCLFHRENIHTPTTQTLEHYISQTTCSVDHSSVGKVTNTFKYIDDKNTKKNRVESETGYTKKNRKNKTTKTIVAYFYF